MDIYQRLIVDHEKQRDLMEKIMQTHGDSEERRKLFAEFKLEADSHANAEEQTFYAALIDNHDTQEQTRHSVAEHKETCDLIDELDEMDMSSPGWIQKFEKLKEELTHHVDEEEEDVFPMAKKVIGKSEADKMAKEFEERKATEQKDMPDKSTVKKVA